jgi:hypothetical protein
MIDLNRLYSERFLLKTYDEQIFSRPEFKTGLLNPYLFIVDKEASTTATHYTLSSIEDIGYDIHIITSYQKVLFYLIDVKYAYHDMYINGIVIRNKKNTPLPEIGQDVSIKYNMDHFLVISNKSGSCTVFGKNMTTDPKT